MKLIIALLLPVFAFAQSSTVNGVTGQSVNGGVATTLTGQLVGSNLAKQDVMDAPAFCADAGSTDAYACNLSAAITGYVTGTHYRFKANTANVGAASINFNSIGAKTVVKVAGGITTTLANNDILVGQWVDVVYDGTNMQMQSTLGNAPGGSGTVTVVSAGSLTSTAIVTGGGTTTLQTPSSAATVDSSGNIVANSVTAANGFSSGATPPSLPSGGTGGAVALGTGTAPGANCVVAGVLCLYATTSGLMESLNNVAAAPLIQGPTSSTNLDGACMSGTTGNIIADCGFVPVTNARTVSTTSPITGGGALSANLTLACATCVVSTTPGAGIAHFAGSTQTATSSLVVSADLNITTTTCSSQFVSAISATAVGTCSGLTAAEMAGSAVPAASVTLSGPSQIFVCTTTCTVTVPVPALNVQYCILNDDNVATVITLSAIGSSARYENSARTAYGTAGTGTFVSAGAVGTGTFVSAGAVGDMVCIVGRDSTHYLTTTFKGTWTAN